MLLRIWKASENTEHLKNMMEQRLLAPLYIGWYFSNPYSKRTPNGRMFQAASSLSAVNKTQGLPRGVSHFSAQLCNHSLCMAYLW